MGRKASTGLLIAHALFALAASRATIAQDEDVRPLTLGDGTASRLSIADPDLVERYIASLRKTREGLAGYDWHARAAIRVDGREWIIQLFDARLDRDGRIRQTLTGHESEDTTLDGPIRHRVVPLGEPAEAAGGVATTGSATTFPADEQAAALKRLAESYTHPEPADVRRVPLLPAPLTALQPLPPLGGSSPVPAGEGESPIETSFRMYDVIRSGDSFEVWLGDEDGLPVRLEAQTDLDGAPVEVTAQYSRLPDGTVCPARAIIRTVIERRAVEIRIDNYGFEKRGRSN